MAAPCWEGYEVCRKACNLGGRKAAVEHLFWLPEKQVRPLIYSMSQPLPHVTLIVYLPAQRDHRIRIIMRLCIPALKPVHSITATEIVS